MTRVALCAAFTGRILRKRPELPRYIVVPPTALPAGTGAFIAMVALNGGPAYQRHVRPWGKGADVWFFNLTAPQCREGGLDTGDLVAVTVEARPGPSASLAPPSCAH